MLNGVLVFQIELDITSGGFEVRRKPEYPGKNLSEQGSEPKRNTNLIAYDVDAVI